MYVIYNSYAEGLCFLLSSHRSLLVLIFCIENIFSFWVNQREMELIKLGNYIFWLLLETECFRVLQIWIFSCFLSSDEHDSLVPVLIWHSSLWADKSDNFFSLLDSWDLLPSWHDNVVLPVVLTVHWGQHHSLPGMHYLPGTSPLGWALSPAKYPTSDRSGSGKDGNEATFSPS